MDEIRFNKLLLLVGSSGAGERAVATAIALARLHGAALVALNVVDKMAVNRMQRFSDKSAAEIEVEMEEDGWKYLYTVEEESKDRGVRTMVMQKTGEVASEVLQEASRLDADLIVLAFPRKAAGQSRRLVQGNVERIVENAEVPVLVVK